MHRRKLTSPLVTLVLFAGAFLVWQFVLAPSVQAAGLTNPLGENDPRKIIGNVIKALLSVTGSLALAGDRVPMGVFGACYEGAAPCNGYVTRIGKAVAFAPERVYRAARRARIARGEGA